MNNTANLKKQVTELKLQCASQLADISRKNCEISELNLQINELKYQLYDSEKFNVMAKKLFSKIDHKILYSINRRGQRQTSRLPKGLSSIDLNTESYQDLIRIAKSVDARTFFVYKITSAASKLKIHYRVIDGLYKFSRDGAMYIAKSVYKKRKFRMKNNEK